MSDRTRHEVSLDEVAAMLDDILPEFVDVGHDGLIDARGMADALARKLRLAAIPAPSLPDPDAPLHVRRTAAANLLRWTADRLSRRVYLAGRFSRRDEFNGYAERLRLLGFTVDARWLTEEHEWYGEHDEDALAAARRFASDDLSDVLAADIVLVFTEPPAPGGRNRGGRHVEFGIALGQGKDIVVVGPPENVFHNLRGSIGLPDGTMHGTTARIAHAATFKDVPDRLADWLYLHDRSTP